MQKRIVVLGGVGFIGTHLCLRLLKEGHEVFCVDVRDAANSRLLRDAMQYAGFRYVRHNIVHPFGIRCDEIYNLVAPTRVRYDKALPVEALKLNFLGSVHALDTARAERARVVYASMCCPQIPGPADDLTTRRTLAEGKRMGEALHRAYRQEFGTDTRIARIGNTYGPGADLLDQRVVMKTIVAALQNRDIQIDGSGEQMRTFCWVEDIVEGLVRLMEAPPADRTLQVDLGSTHEIAIRALAEQIIALTGSRSHLVHTTARADDAPRRTPDLTAARNELGWAPRTPLAEGLRRTIGYVKKELATKACAAITWAEMN